LHNNSLHIQKNLPLVLKNLYDVSCNCLGFECGTEGGEEELNVIPRQEAHKLEEPKERTPELHELEASNVSSPTLARLIEEVRNEEAQSAHAYNRMHNRHNRSR
jgi:hypothetical protein